MNIITIILIGLSLSMDTFSLSLSLGTINISKKTFLIYGFLVGLFHFIFPLLGYSLSLSMQKLFTINGDSLLTIIFCLIAFSLLINLFSKEEKQYKFNIIDMLICAISVSIDSFTIGIGLLYQLKEIILCCITFFVLSSFFTILGFILGSLCKYKLGNLAKILGLIIIILLIIFH